MGDRRTILFVRGPGEPRGKFALIDSIREMAAEHGVDIIEREAGVVVTGRDPTMIMIDELPSMPDIPRKLALEEAMPFTPNNRKARRADAALRRADKRMNRR